MADVESAFLYETPIFEPLITGLSSVDPAVRLAAVHHAFRSMDRAVEAETKHGASIVQALCDIIILHLRAESESRPNVKINGLYDIVGRTILEQLGRRIERASDTDPIKFRGNPLPSFHLFHTLVATNPGSQTEVSLITAGLKMPSLKLSDCCFSGANFTESSFQYAAFKNCDLSYCSFHGAQLGDVTISGDLSYSIFIAAVINFAEVSADVTDTQFQMADLTGSRCVFHRASGANFYGCNIRQANLQGSDINIELSQAIVDYDTVFPDGTRLSRKSVGEGGEVTTRWGTVTVQPDHI